jgi:N-acetylglucosaminylphosphatidylinositol deacetylase
MGLMDLPLSFGSGNMVICTPWDVLTIYRAIGKHRSQLVWFRKLYIIFSRYLLMNTFRLVPRT